MKQVNFLMEEDTYEILKLKKVNMSEFIRQAIDNELKAEHDYANEFRKINTNVRGINSDSLHQALGDLIVTAQTIFTEQLTQRELLKLAHRRATFAASFSMYALDELRKETKTSSSELNELINMVENEHKELNIFREDKK